uniref:PqiC family protein n=1 Tax=Bordetella sputigena TaxID=1416810 RepID=UPI0039EE1353
MNRRNYAARGKCVLRILLCTMLALPMLSCTTTRRPTLLTLPASSASGSPQIHTEAEGRRIVAVGRLELPEYMVTRRVRYRDDASTLAEWPNTYWAERIEISTAREFHAALRAALPAWQLCEERCSNQTLSLSLRLRVDRLDYVRSERRLHATVDIALWSAGTAPRLLRNTVHQYDIAGDTDTAQAQARAMSELLRDVAADTAQSISLTDLGGPT